MVCVSKCFLQASVNLEVSLFLFAKKIFETKTSAGKTSLLDMLAGRKTVGVLGGEIRANGRERGKDWKRLSGYVMQGFFVSGVIIVLFVLKSLMNKR
jgi:hypothetical protein